MQHRHQPGPGQIQQPPPSPAASGFGPMSFQRPFRRLLPSHLPLAEHPSRRNHPGRQARTWRGWMAGWLDGWMAGRWRHDWRDGGSCRGSVRVADVEMRCSAPLTQRAGTDRIKPAHTPHGQRKTDDDAEAMRMRPPPPPPPLPRTYRSRATAAMDWIGYGVVAT